MIHLPEIYSDKENVWHVFKTAETLKVYLNKIVFRKQSVHLQNTRARAVYISSSFSLGVHGIVTTEKYKHY